MAIAYTRCWHADGRYHRPIAGWPGDVGMVPHLMGVLKAAQSMSTSFGEVSSIAGGNRKQVAALVEKRIRSMLLDHLRGRLWR